MRALGSSKRAFSSPGKALIAGGYLVLDPTYDSYITALSARTHCVVNSIDRELETENSIHKSVVIVSSPQFKDSKWEYEIVGTEVKEIKGKTNPFLQATMEIVFSYLKQHSKQINITIYSDPGFHSQEKTTTKTSSNRAKTFLYHEESINNVAKTGLGSSASLVSVVTMALVSQFFAEQPLQKNLVHNLGQIAHCKAQGKIGSGFDVATAVYGSIKYRRFQPQLINDYIGQFTNLQTFRDLVDNQWDFVHQPCSLPPRIKLLMGDIQGGSETPKLVSIVLKWRNLNPNSDIYDNLNKSNLKLMESLENLHKLYNTNQREYLEAIDFFAAHNIEQTINSKYREFNDLIDSIKQIRINLKKLTLATTADIEPDSQTTLLDNCNSLNGVLGGVVPGAGGYDAISLLVIESSVESIIRATTNPHFSQVQWLDLQEEAAGLIEQSVDDYVGLSDD